MLGIGVYYNRRMFDSLFFIVLQLVSVLWSLPETAVSLPTATTTAAVVRVIDGDTIDVDEGQGVYRVRYIGIDTPEPYAGEEPECFSTEATAANVSYVEGKQVVLVADTEYEDTYNRALRYVYVGDTHINEQLVAEGYATTLTIPPNTRFSERFTTLEQQAREEGRGLWDACR